MYTVKLLENTGNNIMYYCNLQYGIASSLLNELYKQKYGQDRLIIAILMFSRFAYRIFNIHIKAYLIMSTFFILDFNFEGR